MRVVISTAVLAVSLFSITDMALAQPRYTLTDLGTLGGEHAVAYAINDFGQVVGRSEFEPYNDNYHAFLWENGQMTDLGTLGETWSRAVDINSSRQVVGYCTTPTGGGYPSIPFLWENGEMTALDSEFGRARSINDAGHVVGKAWDYGAVIWDSDGNIIQDLALAPDAINNVGQVVGIAKSMEVQAYDTHAFVWENGELTDLGTFSGMEHSSSDAHDINDLGQIVGRSNYSGDSSRQRAVLWEEGEITDLGTLGEDKDWMGALAINEAGQIVGYSSSHTLEAVLWNDGEIYNLNDLVENNLGMRLATGQDINNHGEIVGSGYIGDDKRAFLLTPVPEPASLVSALIGVGAIGLIAAARRRRRRS